MFIWGVITSDVWSAITFYDFAYHHKTNFPTVYPKIYLPKFLNTDIPQSVLNFRTFSVHTLCIFQDTVEFDLLFEKVYKWNASSVEDKEAFITCLWKVNC